MIDYIPNFLMSDRLEELLLYGEIDENGKREKEIIKNISCYIQEKQRVKYVNENKQILLNGYVYIKGDITKLLTFDGSTIINGNKYRVVGGRKFEDPITNKVVYTRLEVI